MQRKTRVGYDVLVNYHLGICGQCWSYGTAVPRVGCAKFHCMLWASFEPKYFPLNILKLFFVDYQIKPLTLIREKAAIPSFQPILSLEMFFKSESFEKPDMKMSIFLTRLTNV